MADVLIVGAGIVGLAVARALVARDAALRVTVLEKEAALGAHASGRNSGVVHAGIYYPPGSLKARFCAAGAAALTEFCAEHRVSCARLGKLIVPVTAGEAERIPGLFANARANGAAAELVSPADARRIEPEIEAAGDSLLSPSTACVDPRAVVEALATALERTGRVSVVRGCAVLGVDPERRVVRTSAGEVSFGFLVNAAGAFADRVAAPFGCGLSYRILPFRGAYWELAPESGLTINGNIYPVPDPELPFLGVHFTRSVAGKIYVGPTAMPAFGREHYGGLAGVAASELLPLLGRLARQYTANTQGFRRHAHQEGRYLVKALFVKAAQRLVPRLRAEQLLPSKKRGIRPQLYNMRKRALEMDFVVERTPVSLHVLNTISPGFTCALPFGEYLADQITL